MECFMDRLAHAAGQDPVRFRLALLKDHPRHAAVLRRLAEAAQWDQPLPKGRARGVALHEAMGSIVGQVVEASLKDKALKVHRVVAVVDCGLLVNPLTAEAQIKGGILFALTAAQYGEVNIAGGRVQQSGFRDYRLVRMSQAPAIEVHFMDNGQPHGGIGEPGVPPLAPALANALFALTGERIDTLPLAKRGYTLA
jgi:CO/xanthine dehydrogenase Mo-binding subunit